MKKISIYLMLGFLPLYGLLAQTVQFSATITSATTFDIYFTPSATFTSGSGGISSFGVTLQSPGTVPSGSCAANASAPVFTITPSFGQSPLGGSAAAQTNAGNTAAGTAWWNQLYSFTAGTGGANTTFTGGTAYKLATVTLPAGVDMNCMSLVDFASNKIPGQGGLPRGGTTVNIAASPSAITESSTAIFANATGTNGASTVPPPATNGGSAASTSTMPLAWNNVLPVTLVSFTGIGKDCSAQLAWQSATEVNNSYYEVQTSSDGSGFTTAGKVASKNSATGAGYSYQYNGLKIGNNFFRLKMVDIDGKFTYSPTVSVAGTGDCAARPVTVSPNPATSAINVNGLVSGDQVALLDGNGKQLALATANGTSQSFNVSMYAKGVYIVRIKSASGSSTNVKVVKQ